MAARRQNNARNPTGSTGREGGTCVGVAAERPVGGEPEPEINGDKPLRIIRRELDRDEPVGGQDRSGRGLGRRARGRSTAVEVGSGSRRMPAGALVWMAVSRATTSAPWRIRAASLTWRWLIAGSTVGRATALTTRMIKITTSSSMRVNRAARPAAASAIDSHLPFMITTLRSRRSPGGSGC